MLRPGLPGACDWKRPNSVLKKLQILDFTKYTFGKKGQTLNKPRLEKMAYLINVQIFLGRTFKNGQICHIWPWKGQLGNPGSGVYTHHTRIHYRQGSVKGLWKFQRGSTLNAWLRMRPLVCLNLVRRKRGMSISLFQRKRQIKKKELDRAGHFRYFWIFSTIKNDFIALIA